LIEQLGERFTTYDKKGNIVVNGKPRVLFLENVRNLQEHDNKRTYRIIKERLEKCGYTIYEKVLNTMDYTDLPQNRERIYIIGFRDEQDATRFHFFDKDVLSQHEVHKSSKDRANDVKRIINYGLTAQTAGKYYYTRAKYPHYFVTEEEFTGSAKEIRVNLEEQVDEMYQFYQCRRGQYVRKNKSDVCPTLTANMGTGGHNVPLIRVKDGIRKITPEEAFKLQGFPVGNGYQLPTAYKGKVYSDSHLYKQAGNAVSVPMIRMLAQAILEIIQ
jgi:DNA (cytosine-5)-methyltransferase 1